MSDPSPDDALPFDLSELKKTPPKSYRVKKRRLSPQWTILGVALVLLALVGSAVMYYSSAEPPSLSIAPVGDVAVDQSQTLRITLKTEHTGEPPGTIQYGLRGPEGSQIDPKTGVITWSLGEKQRPGSYTLTVLAKSQSGLTAQRPIRVTVREVVQAPLVEVIDDQGVPANGRLVVHVNAENPSAPDKPLRFSLGPGSPAGARIDPKGGLLEWSPQDAKPGDTFKFTVIVQANAPNSPTAERTFSVKIESPTDSRPTGPREEPAAKPATEKPKEAAPEKVAEKTAKTDPGDAVILELFRKNRILNKAEYPKLRKVYADRFAAKHKELIDRVLGDSSGEFRQWLDQRPEIKEEFYLAIDPKHDDVAKALGLFKELWEKFPRKFEAYANLAIAVAVVWDKEDGAIHGSPNGQHQSVMPDGQVGALENFKYLVDAESVMQGRAQFLPWEFLVHVVNHRTPLRERQWGLNNYLLKRSMIGKCYGDVPYDHPMLRGADPRLKGKEHTLMNQREFGGVCSCQADFATRVAKSLGVPAFEASAASKFGDGHAWVMWVELGSVTRTGFTFSLESHGRYRDDQYYVGGIVDPHTGQPATDRQMELRLHAVGQDPIAKRQADLVMQSYSVIRDTEDLDAVRQLQFLSRVTEFSPGNEEAWKAIAKMSREGQITKAQTKLINRILDNLFGTFKSFPDFTWTVFDDLVAFEDRPKQRAALFGRLAALYEQAKRVDLACEARLKFTDYLLSDERPREAIDILAATILRFPDEGRYVPKMLDKLEEFCRKDKRHDEALVQFYQQFLPKIPQKRGDAPSAYCMQMYKRGIERFRQSGLAPLAQSYQMQLSALEAAAKPRK